MNTFFTPAILKIGEPDWIAKLQAYLESYGITCQGESLYNIQKAEEKLGIRLPGEMREYYEHFGATSDSDFMYSLKPVAEFEYLSATNWSFVPLHFQPSEINSMVVFAESPGNDPLCFDSKTNAIYLFSHDPIKKAKVFTDFSQYVVHELIETERLLGDQVTDAAIEGLKTKYLAGDNNDVDYEFRRMKL
ncbi:SMI1/KNR4 family protein [Hymenobacter sp. M29]|uniref:SMI1/KNR4 family protein n=1 Tax=Hymenobacter mellowenesis TaxID=3063995 RepID=A0ABT9AIL7_9BACT|nr:SMI1/KNR4 family protein [Hymenobacter sp. M29]MDO7849703.1 SMI1/KNR4 family protein [Hymenobacter sp. M29]